MNSSNLLHTMFIDEEQSGVKGKFDA